MFKKIVAIEPVSLVDWAEKKLYEYAEKVVLYEDVPEDDEEILRRIGDADAVLVSYTSKIDRYVLEHSLNIKYVGMCCSLYSKESANVDITCAEKLGIKVYGIRDYGDRGVVEFVLYELVKLLHGYDGYRWRVLPEEIYQKKIGVIGLGVTGTLIAEALKFLGAEVSYYSRTRKPEKEDTGIIFKELHHLLAESEILFNTSIGPSHDNAALKKWLENDNVFFVCDTEGAIGDKADELLKLPNVICAKASAGRTKQAFELLSQKVLQNIEKALQ